MASHLVHFLTVAYAAVGVMALVGYVPQIKGFFGNPELCRQTPLLTWVLWAVQTVVVCAYAFLVNGDHVYILSAVASMTVTVVCFGLLLRGRRLATGKLPQASAEIIPFRPGPGSPLKPVRAMRQRRAA